MLVKSYELQVLVNGRQVKEYQHNGNGFIEAKEGSEFELLIRNNSASRVLAVLSVDGKDVMSGEDCNPEEAGGYVIPALSFIKIPGWRLNNSEVAKFIYASPDKSYAAAMTEGETPLNLGVIGCVIYQEVPNYSWTYSGTYRGLYPKGGSAMPSNGIWYGASDETRSAGNVSDLNSDSNNITDCSFSASQVGTGFGQKNNHRVENTSFDRQSQPDTTLILYYDTRDGLKAKGVQLTPLVSIVPNPFPAAKNSGMCRPPKGWDGK